MADQRREHLIRLPLHHPAPDVVAECTRLRQAGDWAGACRAAGLTPSLDLTEVRAEYGLTAAEQIAADLRRLAPDLLRVFLPPDHLHRYHWGRVLVLTRRVHVHRPRGADFRREPQRLIELLDGPLLVITGPASPDERRGLHLGVTDASRLPNYWTPLPLWCWDAEAVAEGGAAYESRDLETLGDAACVESGLTSAHDLHPLVFGAVRPGQEQRPGPVRFDLPEVMVRCTGRWHRMRVGDGRLATLDHTPQEIQRELTLGALGGPVQGCAAALRAWQTGHGRLPKRLRWQRTDLYRAARHGRADVVIALLDAGFDPAVAEGSGGTLLHVLSHLDHELLLPRLLAAGLPVNGADKEGGTPLHHAEEADARELVAALLAAGADPDVRDRYGRLPAKLRPALRYDAVAKIRTPLG